MKASDDLFASLGKTFGRTLAEKLWERHGAQAEKLLEDLVSSYLNGPARSAPNLETGHAMPSLDPFKVLGLMDTASIPEIREAYRTRAKLYHPDRSHDEGIWLALKWAYDEALRRAHS